MATRKEETHCFNDFGLNRDFVKRPEAISLVFAHPRLVFCVVVSEDIQIKDHEALLANEALQVEGQKALFFLVFLIKYR